MQRRVLLLLAALLALTLCHAQAPTPPATATAPELKIEDTKAFFEDFIQKGTPPEKSEFETTAEYQKRLPKYEKITQTYYFSVPYHSSKKRYTYNADTQTMTIIGCYLETLFSDEESFCAQNKLLVTTLFDRRVTDSYTATNAFGVKKIMEVVSVKNDKFCFTNLDRIPKQLIDGELDGEQYALVIFPIQIAPKEAEALSKNIDKNVEFIVGIHPVDYTQSICLKGSTEATFDFPYDLTHTTLIIKGNLTKLILRNCTTKEIIAQYDIPENDTPTPKN